MRSLVFIFIVLVLVSCTAKEESSNIITAKVLYKYDLPADGCDWHFYIYDKNDSDFLKEDHASKSLTDELKKHAQKANGLPKVTVTLTYLLTGKLTKVMCGWNKTKEMKEITIVKYELN